MFVSMLWHRSAVLAVMGPYDSHEEAEIAGVKFMVKEYADNWDNSWDLSTDLKIGIGIGERLTPTDIEFRVWWDTIELNKVR